MRYTNQRLLLLYFLAVLFLLGPKMGFLPHRVAPINVKYGTGERTSH